MSGASHLGLGLIGVKGKVLPSIASGISRTGSSVLGWGILRSPADMGIQGSGRASARGLGEGVGGFLWLA